MREPCSQSQSFGYLLVNQLLGKDYSENKTVIKAKTKCGFHILCEIMQWFTVSLPTPYGKYLHIYLGWNHWVKS